MGHTGSGRGFGVGCGLSEPATDCSHTSRIIGIGRQLKSRMTAWPTLPYSSVWPSRGTDDRMQHFGLTQMVCATHFAIFALEHFGPADI